MTTPDDWTAVVDEKLDHVLTNPRGWGGLDALEPLVLMLLMLRAKFSAPPASRTDVVRQYRKFLAGQFGPGSGDIRERLGAGSSLEDAVQLLRKHVDNVRAFKNQPNQTPTPPLKSRRPQPQRRATFPRISRPIEHEAV